MVQAVAVYVTSLCAVIVGQVDVSVGEVTEMPVELGRSWL